jgi:hypothetical protein
MIAARIIIYLLPEGIRFVEGYIAVPLRPSIGVAKLKCSSGKMRWFAFTQPHGARVTDGHATAEAAFDEGNEIVATIARLRGDPIGEKRYVTGPSKWQRANEVLSS